MLKMETVKRRLTAATVIAAAHRITHKILMRFACVSSFFSLFVVLLMRVTRSHSSAGDMAQILAKSNTIVSSLYWKVLIFKDVPSLFICRLILFTRCMPPSNERKHFEYSISVNSDAIICSCELFQFVLLTTKHDKKNAENKENQIEKWSSSEKSKSNGTKMKKKAKMNAIE